MPAEREASRRLWKHWYTARLIHVVFAISSRSTKKAEVPESVYTLAYSAPLPDSTRVLRQERSTSPVGRLLLPGPVVANAASFARAGHACRVITVCQLTRSESHCSLIRTSLRELTTHDDTCFYNEYQSMPPVLHTTAVNARQGLHRAGERHKHVHTAIQPTEQHFHRGGGTRPRLPTQTPTHMKPQSNNTEVALLKCRGTRVGISQKNTKQTLVGKTVRNATVARIP